MTDKMTRDELIKVISLNIVRRTENLQPISKVAGAVIDIVLEAVEKAVEAEHLIDNVSPDCMAYDVAIGNALEAICALKGK